MKTIVSAKDAKNKFGEVLDNAQKNPITISKHGRAFVVIISQEEYEKLRMLEDEWWGMRAENAKKKGFLGIKATEKFFSEMLHDEN